MVTDKFVVYLHKGVIDHGWIGQVMKCWIEKKKIKKIKKKNNGRF